jgi:hypothetical protein
LVTEHPPQLCQTSNAQIRARFQQGDAKARAAVDSLGLEILAGPLIASDHRSFTVIRANDVDTVRVFALESGLIQWNSVQVIPCITYEDSVAELERVSPIF